MLQTEQDFYDLMYAYLKRAAYNSVLVAEIFFDPQTHTDRGIPMKTVVNGLHRAVIDGYEHFKIKASLIMCFLRHLSEDTAFETLKKATPFLDKIVAVGLDSGEQGNPPSKFKKVFDAARGYGLKVVAHAGEEAGPDYIREALDVLCVARIDHGVLCLKDEQLVERLAAESIPLTVCPLSNDKLQVNSRFFQGKNMTKVLLDKGLMVTINSDDPAYFGGYITDNFVSTVSATGMTAADVYQICRNSFMASFLPLTDKQLFLSKLKQYNVLTGYSAPSRSISMFGSRGPRPGTPAYELAYNAAKLFAAKGFKVLSGGYAGVMEAVCHGAKDGGGETVGVLAPSVFANRIEDGNVHLASYDKAIRYSCDLLERITGLVEMSEYFLIFPGTVGTVTELMVVWNLASCRAMRNLPKQRIFLFRNPWEKIVTELISSTKMYQSDANLVTFIDTAEEVLELVEQDLQERVQLAII